MSDLKGEQLETRAVKIVLTRKNYGTGRVDGWMDEWMDRSKSWVKDCYSNQKISLFALSHSTKNYLYQGNFVPLEKGKVFYDN